ncbi:MAG: DMT family transporter [Chloroflexi bacterium]|jgi:drug/metabolite transporter (DMT)-like permease|nr:DMT family transporter [Chloroflexota bacterium]MBT3669792.1 DMT family transporter [Chloroflexota bacterium]MBT4003737.1 DMT family transporter [Chloroflexota bacterium]MBT4304693.1 DMT family transporter [Chloroflexota bacterium]MBT4534805.1 DMT family transporter [Chloroflexota bacterium]
MTLKTIGELAAIGTAICFSIGPTFFTLAGKSVGSVIVNRTRLVIAVFLLLIVHWIAYGNLLPPEIEGFRWLWLGLSGVIGLTLGDAALFQALINLGPRLTMLIFALSPVIGIGLGWMFLDETLGLMQIIGIIITLGGISWVVSNQENGDNKIADRKKYLWGIAFAVLGAAGQAIGLFTAKKGLIDGFPALSGQIIRMLAATISIWIWTLLIRKGKETIKTIRENPNALKLIFIASLIGPMLGVWLSLVSVQNTELGISSTLQSLPPIFLIPISIYFFKEKVNFQSILGTVISLVGVAIIFLA